MGGKGREERSELLEWVCREEIDGTSLPVALESNGHLVVLGLLLAVSWGSGSGGGCEAYDEIRRLCRLLLLSLCLSSIGLQLLRQSDKSHAQEMVDLLLNALQPVKLILDEDAPGLASSDDAREKETLGLSPKLACSESSTELG